MGGGDDRPMKDPASRQRSRAVHALLLEQRDSYYPELAGQPPSCEWVGPMGFTPDQLPAIGVLRPGVIVGAGFNGYGGSYTTAAGQALAEIVLGGAPPAWAPADVFSPLRFRAGEPLFLAGHEGLWRIAASLCRQLKEVSWQLRDALSFSAEDAEDAEIKLSARRTAPARGQSTSATPEELAAFPAFAAFDRAELVELLASMRQLDLPAKETLFREGEFGGTCFLVLRGAIDVCASIRGRDTCIATMTPGSIFGQLSLIRDEPRSATCIAARDATLLELRRAACKQLFDSRTPMALKFLATLTQRLIADLREVDQRLMLLDDQRRPEQQPPIPVLSRP
jgi:CRP-like cAMP-binding protein